MEEDVNHRKVSEDAGTHLASGVTNLGEVSERLGNPLGHHRLISRMFSQAKKSKMEHSGY